MYSEVVHAVYRRGENHVAGYQLPGWGWGLLFLDLLIFLPVFLIVRTMHTRRQGKEKQEIRMSELTNANVGELHARRHRPGPRHDRGPRSAGV